RSSRAATTPDLAGRVGGAVIDWESLRPGLRNRTNVRKSRVRATPIHTRGESAMTLQPAQSTNGRLFWATLPPGSRLDPSWLRIRAIRASDATALQQAFEGLSPTSRYFRFLSPLRQLSDRMAHYLTHVDGNDHVALVAIDRSHAMLGIGVARFVRN